MQSLIALVSLNSCTGQALITLKPLSSSSGNALISLVSLNSSPRKTLEALSSGSPLISLRPIASLEALSSGSRQALEALRSVIALRSCRSGICSLETLLALRAGTAAARPCRSRGALRARATAAATRNEGPRRRRNAQRHDLAEISAQNDGVRVDDASIGELNGTVWEARGQGILPWADIR